MFASSKIVARGVDIHEPFVEVEVNAAVQNIELECAARAVVVFPAVMGLGEVVVAEGFDRIP